MSIHVNFLVLLSFFIFLTPQNCKAADAADQNAFSHVTIYHSFNNAVAAHFEHILKKFNAISPKFQVIVKKSGPSIDDYDMVMAQSDLAQRPPLVLNSGLALILMPSHWYQNPLPCQSKETLCGFWQAMRMSKKA